MRGISFDSQQIKAFIDYMAAARKVVLVAHRNADGDAVGSTLGMMHCLRAMGKEAVVLLPDGCPDTFRWMEGSECIMAGDRQADECRAAVEQADIVLCLDFNRLSRISNLEGVVGAARCRKVLVDHHHGPESERFDIVFSYPDISSTCELCYWLIAEAWGEEHITRPVAIALYTGMRTDTGGFNFSCYQPSLYEAVSGIMARDIDPDRINHNIFDDFTVARLRYFAYAIERRMRVFEEQRFAYIYVPLSDLDSFGLQAADIEGLVNYTLKIRTVEVGALVREEHDRTKVSLRSKFDYNVERVARETFGGGGHVKAAGADVVGVGLSEVIHRVETVFLPEEQWTPEEQITAMIK